MATVAVAAMAGVPAHTAPPPGPPVSQKVTNMAPAPGVVGIQEEEPKPPPPPAPPVV